MGIQAPLGADLVLFSTAGILAHYWTRSFFGMTVRHQVRFASRSFSYSAPSGLTINLSKNHSFTDLAMHCALHWRVRRSCFRGTCSSSPPWIVRREVPIVGWWRLSLLDLRSTRSRLDLDTTWSPSSWPNQVHSHYSYVVGVVSTNKVVHARRPTVTYT